MADGSREPRQLGTLAIGIAIGLVVAFGIFFVLVVVNAD